MRRRLHDRDRVAIKWRAGEGWLVYEKQPTTKSPAVLVLALSLLLVGLIGALLIILCPC